MIKNLRSWTEDVYVVWNRVLLKLKETSILVWQKKEEIKETKWLVNTVVYTPTIDRPVRVQVKLRHW